MTGITSYLFVYDPFYDIVNIFLQIIDSDKRLLKYIELFKKQLATPNVTDMPTEEDTEPDD